MPVVWYGRNTEFFGHFLLPEQIGEDQEQQDRFLKYLLPGKSDHGVNEQEICFGKIR